MHDNLVDFDVYHLVIPVRVGSIYLIATTDRLLCGGGKGLREIKVNLW